MPLYDFFITLKRNNFLVTPEQIIDANNIIDQYADTVKNEYELCNYLSPIFANCQEEQIQFKEIFAEFFIPRAALVAIKAKDSGDGIKKKSHLKKHWWKYLLAILALAVVAYLLFPKSAIHPIHVNLKIGRAHV